MTTTEVEAGLSPDAFRHEALLYVDECDFVAGVVPFIREGVELGEPIMVALRLDKIALLRDTLGPQASKVQFVDMGVLGRNPARIIPAWLEFVSKHSLGGQRVRGIGEPVCAKTTGMILRECVIHEELLNVAFAETTGFRLLCPYDTSGLEPSTVEQARRTHPYVAQGGTWRASGSVSLETVIALLAAPLPEPSRHSGDYVFRPGTLYRVRAVVAEVAQRWGMDPDRTEALVVATNEAAVNSLVHGGGEGIFRTWREGDYVVCEVRDKGHFDDLLAGRRPPETGRERGLWVANRLCDLVQIRSSPAGSAVRLHMALAGQSELRLTHLTLHDQLTGLGNRTMLWNRLEEAEADAASRRAVLFCDLDDFKVVNDTYGHRVGDEVLLAVAGRLRDGARPGDTIARVGGDEFIVLCEGVASDGDASVIAERIARALDSPIRTTSGTMSMSMSIGLALSRPGQTVDDLIAEADVAMYAAKRARGGDQNS